jgi:beta-N-acetylhexosaminidase
VSFGGRVIELLVGLCLAAPASAAARPCAGGLQIPQVESTLASLSTEQKVAQLLIIGFAGTQLDASMLHWVQERRVGGVALFSRNLVNLQQTASLTRDLQAHSHPQTPLFIAVDQEGGNVVRIRDDGLLLPGNMALGATRDPRLAYVAGQSVASDLRLLGVNMNLAPVLDINSNPQNPVIGIRSYGETAELVGGLGAWFIRGQQEMGVVAVAKHFPGHGNTQSDSHFSLPSIDVSLAHLEATELRPFAEAIEAGLDAVMTAHIALPKLAEKPDLPATLSHVVLTKLLRQRLGFCGIIMTDGLEMRSIVQRFGSARAAVLAVLAGADMAMVLWEPGAEEKVYQALLQAVQRREISMGRLDSSVRRILTVKWRRGLHQRPSIDPATALQQLHRTPLHAEIAAQIARQAITLVRNDKDLLPLGPAALEHLLVLAPPGVFGEVFEQAGAQVVRVPMVPTRAQRRSLGKTLQELSHPGTTLVAGVVNRYHLEMAKQAVQARQLPLAVVSFASPYYLKEVREAAACVCAYGYLETSQRAAAEMVLGRQPPLGRLPVSIPGVAPYGTGLRLPVAAAP